LGVTETPSWDLYSYNPQEEKYKENRPTIAKCSTWYLFYGLHIKLNYYKVSLKVNTVSQASWLLGKQEEKLDYQITADEGEEEGV